MGRKRELDLLKALAIFGVIVIHTCTDGGFAYPVGSVNWLCTLFWAALVRASVPIFFMCSGVLFLPPEKDLPLKKLYLKYILRILAAMLVWSLLYKVYHLAHAGELSAPRFFEAVKQVLLFKQEFHFYYLQIILLFYACLPVMRAFIQHASKRDVEYALLLWFLTGILYPTLRNFWPFSMLDGIPKQWMMNMTWAAMGYGVLGYYLKTWGISVRASRVFFGAGFLLVFGGTLLMSLRAGKNDFAMLQGMTVGAAVLAAGIFGLCLHRGAQLSKKQAGIAEYLGRASFCVYLAHMFFIYIFREHALTAAAFPTVVSIPAIAGSILLICCGVYFVLSKIPVISKWLI